MKKILSILKVSMTQNMNMFKINTKNSSKISKIVLPIFIAALLMVSVGGYAIVMMEELEKIKLEHLVLTLFAGVATILTIIEGIYKSKDLLFNVKDDDLLLSMPIKKSTVLFIRIFKFYVFEVAFNALLLLPAMIVYITKVNVDASYYLVSLFALLLIPVIPIILSCIFGGISTLIATKTKHKNLVQIVITTIILLVVMYYSFSSQNTFGIIAQNAQRVDRIIAKVYWPVSTYVKLATNFDVLSLIIFIAVHIAIFAIFVLTFGKVYYNINSKTKEVVTKNKSTKYTIKSSTQMKALVKKELSKFFSIPVFVINAGFGPILFVFISIIISIKYNGIVQSFIGSEGTITKDDLDKYIPIIIYLIMSAAVFMTTITSSMISLEKKAFSNLKSLPVKSEKIIMSKIIAAIILMLPALVIGDIILIVRLKINIIYTLIILLTTVILSLLNETIGIIINLKYPKLDAENDTEIVKQSMSSMISVFIGMGLTLLTIVMVVVLTIIDIPQVLTLICVTCLYFIIYGILTMYLKKRSDKLIASINI